MKEIIEKDAIRYVDDKGMVLAEILFPTIKENVYNITHTYVDDSLRGQGIARKLVEQVIEIAHENNYKITAVCSYARSYFAKNENDIYIRNIELN